MGEPHRTGKRDLTVKHSDYTELTRRLALFAQHADGFRMSLTDWFAVDEHGNLVSSPNPESINGSRLPNRVQIWRAIGEADTQIARWMDEWVDGWTESNQERADKDLGPTADERALYDAMVAFMSATATPVDGWGVLYEDTRTRCRAWMDQAVEWFPELYPQFVRDLLDSDYYKQAVKGGYITPPFIWNDSIRQLAFWLENSEMLSQPKYRTVKGRTQNDWSLVDGLFQVDGKRVTAEQLRNGRKG